MLVGESRNEEHIVGEIDLQESGMKLFDMSDREAFLKLGSEFLQFWWLRGVRDREFEGVGIGGRRRDRDSRHSRQCAATKNAHMYFDSKAESSSTYVQHLPSCK